MMVVLVSTQPRRLVAVIVGGTAIAVVLALVARNTSGLSSLVSIVGALAAASLTVAYVIAVVVEGSIDRRRRTALSNRLGPVSTDEEAVQRCSHCLRPQVTAGGVSICPNCDQ